MAGYFNYSPWPDAAEYGRGFGQTISQAMLRAPQQRMEMQQQKERFPLEQELLKAQISSALSQPELRKLMLQAALQRADNQGAYQKGQLKIGEENAATRKSALDEKTSFDTQKNITGNAMAQTKEALAEINAALGEKKLETMGQPKPETAVQTDAGVKRGMEAQKLLGSTLGTNTVPSLSAAEWAQKEQAGSPTNSIFSILQKIMQPKTETNEPGMLSRLMGGQPTVTTNGARFVAPNRESPTPPLPVTQQPAAQAPAPWIPPPQGYERTAVNPKTGQRLGLVNGQWIPIQ